MRPKHVLLEEGKQNLNCLKPSTGSFYETKERNFRVILYLFKRL